MDYVHKYPLREYNYAYQFLRGGVYVKGFGKCAPRTWFMVTKEAPNRKMQLHWKPKAGQVVWMTLVTGMNFGTNLLTIWTGSTDNLAVGEKIDFLSLHLRRFDHELGS